MYTELGTLYDGPRTRVVRAVAPDGRRVVLKQLRTAWPTPAEITRLRREHDLLSSLDADVAPRVVGLDDREPLQLVTEDVGALALGRWLDRARGSAEAALEVALNITRALAAVHERGILHLDVNPSNLVGDPETRRMWLIDFDLATRVAGHRAAPHALGSLVGTAAYLAPEQTGRMNRAVDFRSDLYALGVTLYQLFSGELPFQGDDLLALAHAHLARPAPRLVPTVPGLPPEVSLLVGALLEKRPEDRYQSAAGLVLDLEQLLVSVRTGEAPSLRGRSVSSRLDLPGELYGRGAESAALLEAFARTTEGACTAVLVSGEAGIGKTSLVRELYRPVTVAGGRLLEGKFEQFSRDLPYSALGHALADLATEILAAPTAEVDRWRERILRATAPNTALLLRLCPALEVLLGAQPDVTELAPTESERRLHETLRRVFVAIAGPDRPLVLFLDDLQWADLPSLRVLEALFRDPGMGHLMLVGAWRPEEIGADHALRPTLRAIADSGVEVVSLGLGPLAVDDVAAWLAAPLHRRADEVAPLADALHRLSGGNAFFLRRLTERAAAQGAIAFDAARLTWTWDPVAVEQLGVADNVVEMLRREIGQLSGAARAVLSAGALAGEAFGFDALATATGLPVGALREALGAAVAGRFVQPLDGDWWLEGVDADRPFRFAFVHDRVQQAARELLDDDERARVHLALARFLHTRLDTDATPFQVAEHYGAALGVIGDPAERSTVLAVHHLAGARAMASGAHSPAHRFLEVAVGLAGDDLWERDPDAARELWRLAARAAWVVGRPDRIEAHVVTLRARSRDDVDRLHAEEAVIQSRIAAGDLHGALDSAVAALSAVGVPLLRKPTGGDVMAAVGAAMGAVAGHTVDTLAATTCVDPTERATRRLLVRIASAAYVAEPDLLPLIACHLVQRTVAVGASPESAYGFGVFSLCLCAGWLLEPGTEQGRIALGLLERFPDRVLEGTVRHVVHHFARVWNDPLRDVYDDVPDVFRSLMDAGDLEYAGWVQHFRAVYGLFSGVPLPTLADEVRQVVATMRLHDVAASLHCTLPVRQLVEGLRGHAADPARLVGPDFDEDAAFALHTSTNFRAAALMLSVSRLLGRLLSGDVAGAAAVAHDVIGLQDGAVALFYQCPMRVYAALAVLDAADDPAAAVATVLPWREPVAACAARNPGSGAHLLALFDAGVAQARGDLAEAILAYDRAIELAGRAGFTHDEGLAAERAGRLHLARGARRLGRIYLRDARYAWERWGATALVDRLDAAHPDLLATVRDHAPVSASLGATSMTQASFDFESVLRGSQAIAEEVHLDDLISRSMRVLLENVGARRGVLLLARRGELRVEGVGTADGEIAVLDGLDFEDGRHVSPSVVRRVWRRGEVEVHDALAEDGRPERSVLCAPITFRGRALGVLYFENDLSAGAFSADRVRVLEVLAAQLAVSVRNVRLHEAQSRFVPSQFLRSLGRSDIVDVEVGDHELKEVSVFFSDIWGFTSLVEHLPAAEALGFVNRYLSFAEPAITGGGGFVDTYLGDGIMALFDAHDRSADDAVGAAIAVHHALDRFNEVRRGAGQREIRTGVGINTGVVTLATIGAQRSVKCGVVGDAVNLASRVEGLTRRSGARLLVSDATRARLRDASAYTMRRAGLFRVKGRVQPLTVWEVLDAEPPAVLAARASTLEPYEAALSAYYARDMEGALAALTECVARVPGDPQARRFLASVLAFGPNGPPDGWTGVEDA
jgi:predicted ATPase/class 3 adenylate cyclase